MLSFLEKIGKIPPFFEFAQNLISRPENKKAETLFLISSESNAPWHLFFRNRKLRLPARHPTYFFHLFLEGLF
ncbi:hypothetical protein A4G20_09935 [Pasteurellaceae bacterium RH1A]|nr:hypothetical protein A4G20_09935 [Pasteurellaceae bacterium RH1A]